MLNCVSKLAKIFLFYSNAEDVIKAYRKQKKQKLVEFWKENDR